MANQEGRGMRRSIRSDAMRRLFNRALDAGWAVFRDGAGHLRLTSPDGTTFMTMSTTAIGGRAVQNNEAVFKRWLRSQKETTVSNEKIEAAIDRQEIGVSIIGREPESTTVNESDEAIMEGEAEAEPETKTDAGQDEIVCDQCGKTFKRYGFGRHKRSHDFRYKRTPEGPMVVAERLKAPSGANGHAPDLFTINEVITIAEFGGSGGLIEVSKLRDGLIMVSRLRKDQ